MIGLYKIPFAWVGGYGMEVFVEFSHGYGLGLGFRSYVLIIMSSWNCQTSWMPDARHRTSGP